ncbi:MAG: hypothetical protein LUD17_10995 [Bacteroidales bacterium]|nr:hypothetical protein [Bacteroidales bacterium]
MKYSVFTLDSMSKRKAVSEAQIALFEDNDGNPQQAHIVVKILDATLSPEQQMAEAEMCLLMARSALSPQIELVMKRYFLTDAAGQKLSRQLIPCAVSKVEQAPVDGTAVAIWAHFMRQPRVERLDNGWFEVSNPEGRHLWLTGAQVSGASSEDATRRILTDLAEQLKAEGLSLADNCMRTWLFVRDIDNNYKGVVNGRNEAFAQYGLTPETHFIASTGIAGASADPRSTVMIDAYAIDGIKPEQVRYLHAPHRLNPTHEYGVAFERGTAIDFPTYRQVIISGTASINNRGEVVHVGDIEGQTRVMLDNIEALLADAGADWEDVGHAIIYLRNPEDYNRVKPILDERIGWVPHVALHAPVCRPEWLIEVECMACLTNEK